LLSAGFPPRTIGVAYAGAGTHTSIENTAPIAPLNPGGATATTVIGRLSRWIVFPMMLESALSVRCQKS